MAWTEPQTRGIFERGSNILVSAGAGSGKTAVLSERILEYCKAGNDIRNVLVLTFTNAAAREMKERIRKKLLENGLTEQADYIDAAYITTFDAYSLALVKKYFYKLGLSKNLGIMDGTLISLKRKEVIDSLFEELYQREDQRFFSYLMKYSKQDDTEIRNTLEKLCGKLELIVDYEAFRNSYLDVYLSDAKLNEIISDYENLCKENVDALLIQGNELLEHSVQNIKFYDGLDVVLNNIRCCVTYEDYVRVIPSTKLPTLRNATDELKEEKDAFKKELDRISEKLFGKYSTTSAMKEELASVKNDIIFLLDMCDEITNRLMEYKRSVMQFDYTDIAKFAIRLVTEFDDVNHELKYFYKEILVDEYQDTSDIQETFLSAIANDNMYMVGDIKQSIYRFRNANPYIFKKKYDDYSNENGGIKIDLLHNFRSRSEVLGNINMMFNKLMTESCGDADYIRDHQMNYGQKDYEKLNQDIDFNLEVLKYDKDILEDFPQDVQEAFIVAKEIKKVMNSGAKVLRDGKFVDVTYSDFAILIDKAKTFVTFKQVFEYLNIPLSIEADLDLKDSVLPKLFSNIMMLIYKTRINELDVPYKHALASVARSFIYNYTDEEIYKMIILHEHKPILDDIKELSEIYDASYKTLFFEITNKMGIYEKLALIGDVDGSLCVMESIYKMFTMFGNTSITLEETIDYLNGAFESDAKLSYKVASSGDNVRIMTIHKSKGLEFPYCYFPMLSSGFNKEDAKAPVGFNRKYGIYIPFADEGKSNTVVKSLIEDSIIREDISERVRLLYVALTRAREKMIMILPTTDKTFDNPKKFRSFMDMVYYSKIDVAYGKEIDINNYGVTDQYKYAATSVSSEAGTIELEYNPLPKPSVVKKSRISKELHSLPDKETKKKLELGLLFHSALESLDLANPDIEGLPCDDFVKNNLSKVLAHPIMAGIKNGKAYHEHEFYFTDNGESFNGIIDLFVVYDDHVDIIDYKLSGTDSPEYIRQLGVYKKYIESKWNKEIHMYLLSLLKAEIKCMD